MPLQRIALVGLIVATATGVAIAGWFRSRTRPDPWGGIPTRDYQYRSPSQPVTSLSATALPFQRPGDKELGLTERQAKVYQLERPTLAVDHCSISAVAVVLQDDGQWTLSLRADQNPVREETAAAAGPAGQTQTSHLLRNEFHVDIRCYGAMAIPGGDQADRGVGKPVLCVLHPEGFWVQRGQPRHLRTGGRSESLREYFRLIDRAEVEFFYYK